MTLACSVKIKLELLSGLKMDLVWVHLETCLPTPDTRNLEIVNVSLEDDATYQCQVGATDTVLAIRSKYSKLTVTASPQPPVITAGPRMVLREGKTALVQCISKGGKPASIIKWRSDGELVTQGVQDKSVV